MGVSETSISCDDNKTNREIVFTFSAMRCSFLWQEFCGGFFFLLLLLRVVFDPFTVRRVNSWWQTIWKVDILRHFCVQFVNWIFKPSVLMKREIFPIFLFLLFRIESASLFVCSLCSTHCSSFRDGRIYIPSLKLIRQLHFGLLSVLLPFFTPETKINLPIQETR